MKISNFLSFLLLCLIPVAAAHAQAPSYTHTVTLSGNVDADTVAVRVNGTAATTGGTNFSADVDLQFGTNALLVEAEDAAGNVGSTLLTLLIDLPQAQSTACCSIGISGAVDGANAVSVNEIPAAIVGTGFSAEVELAYGVNQVLAVAEDANGNQATHQLHLFVNAENTPPVILSTVPDAAALVTADAAFEMQIQAEDAEQASLFYRSAIQTHPLSDWQSEMIFSGTAADSLSGYQDLKLEVMDSAGATASAEVPVYVVHAPRAP